MTKRLVFCFDGTSNTLDRPDPTNVAITAAAVKNTSKTGPQIVYYDEGVGSTKKDNFVGGAFGAGLYDKVVEAYKFLVFNHEPGDEIFIFGFSRGAYTARSFAGLIHHTGIINSCYADKIQVAATLYQRRDPKAAVADLDEVHEFRRQFVSATCANEDDLEWRKANVEGFNADAVPVLKIRYVGVWDTVKTIGSAAFGDKDGDGEVDDAAFHDDRLNGSIQSARHAVAIDEHRKKFDVTLWENVDDMNRAAGAEIDDPNRPFQEVWFPGGHGAVGGGGDVRGLSDEGLEWVLDGAKLCGLELDTTTVSKIWGIQPDLLSTLDNSKEMSWRPKDVAMRFLPPWIDRVGPRGMHEVSTGAIIRWAAPDGSTKERGQYRPKSLRDLKDQMDEAAKAYEAWEFEAYGGYAEPGQVLHNVVLKDGREFRRLRVGSQDTIGSIARENLGDYKRYREILALNRIAIIDPDRIYAGQILNLPLT